MLLWVAGSSSLKRSLGYRFVRGIEKTLKEDNHLNRNIISECNMKKKEFDPDLEEMRREPIHRKRPKGFTYDDEDFESRNRKKSGKRFHRKPTPKDDFRED